MQDETRELWNLAFTARFNFTRAFALAKLSTIDPEGFKKIRDIVNNTHATQPPPEDLE